VSALSRLARADSGDVAGQVLADLGADVIKVEGPPLAGLPSPHPARPGEMSALTRPATRTSGVSRSITGRKPDGS